MPKKDATRAAEMELFDTPASTSLDDWQKRRAELRETLWRLLGDLPPLGTPEPTTQSRERRDGYTLERFTFQNGVGDRVPGYLLIPDGRTDPGPAILYNHYHGGAYRQGKEEVLIFAFKDYGMKNRITGEELARAGYVVMCIDTYAFGERRFQGPGGKKEEGYDTELSLFKMLLWQGRTLWGMMIRDDQLALSCLAGRPEVDPNRIAAIGMSMGSTRSWWLAALDERVKVVVCANCLTRYQNLIEHGNVGFHGPYYFVPRMLAERIESESVVGLIAPRPLLTLTGDRDVGSPVDGVRIINDFASDLYKLYGQPEHFRGLIYEDTAHLFTHEMWGETVRWLDAHV